MSTVWILAELKDVRDPNTMFPQKVMVRVLRRGHDETTWVPGNIVNLCDEGQAPQRARILFVSESRKLVLNKKELSGMQEIYMKEVVKRCLRTISDLRRNSQTYCLHVEDLPNSTGEVPSIPNLIINRRTGQTSTSNSDYSDSSDEDRISSNIVMNERRRQLANRFVPQPIVNGPGPAPPPIPNAAAHQPMFNINRPAASHPIANGAAPHPLANGVAPQPISNRHAEPQPLANGVAPQLISNRHAAPQPLANGVAPQPISNRHAAPQPLANGVAPQPISNRHAAPQPLANGVAPQPMCYRHASPQPMANGVAPQPIYIRYAAPQQMASGAAPQPIFNRPAAPHPIANEAAVHPMANGAALQPTFNRQAASHLIDNGAAPQPRLNDPPIYPPQLYGLGPPPVVCSLAVQPVQPVVEGPPYPPEANEPISPSIVNEPAHPPVINGPAAQPVVDDPVPPQVVEDPVLPPVVDDPVPQPVVYDPAPQPVANDPAAQPVVDDPVPPQVVEDPVPPQVVEDSVSPQIGEDPVLLQVIDNPVPQPVVEDPAAQPVVTDVAPLPVVNDLAAVPVVVDSPPGDNGLAPLLIVNGGITPPIGNCLASPPVDNGSVQSIVKEPAVILIDDSSTSPPIDTPSNSRNNNTDDKIAEKKLWQRLQKMKKIAKIIDTELQNYTQTKDELTTSSEEIDEENIVSMEQRQSDPQVSLNNLHSEEDNESMGVEIGVQEEEGEEKQKERRCRSKRKGSLASQVLDGSKSYLKRRRMLPHTSFSTIRKKCNNLVEIGAGFAKVPGCIMTSIDWTSYSLATRQLLLSVFPRSALAQYSLLGTQPSVYMKKQTQRVLNPLLVQDIVRTVASKCNVPKDLVRKCIKEICREEIRIFRKNKRKMKHKQRQQIDDYVPLSSSSTNSSSEEIVVHEISD
ncbi:SH3 domain-containing protein C23A1.17-like [Spodoptera litura]|uniref:SH3 domain-containing protein C23A1.17-like n=1 Tax=Spodoptera litura TaxID=69820 RepID=A0A9J7IU23_SPOLT|nr:SH3 domain-containing protein C23A1.17-like [Spodoptera litura]